MSKKVLNTVLIGLGKIGLEYDLEKKSTLLCRTHAKAISTHKNFNLVAAIDKVKKKEKYLKGFIINLYLQKYQKIIY